MGKVNVEFKKVVKEINTLYQKVKTADQKSGKDRYDLGSKLKSLKCDKKFKGFGSFEAICNDQFQFSRIYGYKLIWMYDAQKALHDAGLVPQDTYLGSTMLQMLWKSRKPCKIWELACEKAGNDDPSEAIVSQIIDEQNKQKATSNKDMSSEIAKANADNVCSVLQKIKNAKYTPSKEEQDTLIALLRESWSKKDVDTSAEEDEQEDIA